MTLHDVIVAVEKAKSCDSYIQAVAQRNIERNHADLYRRQAFINNAPSEWPFAMANETALGYAAQHEVKKLVLDAYIAGYEAHKNKGDQGDQE